VMSQFDAEIKQAKFRQKMIFITMCSLIIFGIILISSFFLFSKGIRIDITPNDAKRIGIINIVDGVAFNLKNTIYSISKKVIINITAPGFRDKKVQLDFEKLTKAYSVDLVALPGSLHVSTVPSLKNTKWFIGDKGLSTREELDYQLDAGRYKLIVDNIFYKKKEIDINIERDKKIELNLSLEPINRQIEIKSRPSGAEIIFDGEKVGRTPLTFEKAGGIYDVEVSLNNYLDISDEIEITREDDLVKRDYFFELKKGKINLTLEPKDGLLLLNGIEISNKKSIILDANVEHKLIYQKEGFFTKNKKIKLESNEEIEITFNLLKEFGTVDISTDPQASIYINDKNMGESPISLELQAIPHELMIMKSGYRSIKKIIQPSSKSTIKIDEVLLTELSARLKDSPKEYISKAGGKLKLFLVNEEFFLGADRGEIGQRANEFIRKVRLTKPFYAGMHEVTNEEFQKFQKGEKTNLKDPVTSIKWIDAVAFCNWLSNEENLKPFYNIRDNKFISYNSNADGYRLLSEAEWEWLARKSGKKKQTTFVWGDDKVIPRGTGNLADESAKGKVKVYIANYKDGFDKVAPIGSFKQEKSGLYDMAGNVSEWTHDFYSVVPPSKNKTENNPLGPKNGQMHVIKGANWRSGNMTELRPAFREGLIDGRDDLGFRIGRYLYGGEQ